MTTQSSPSYEKQSRDAASWAQYAATLHVARVPTGALNLNVEGRRAMSPMQGFGQLWQKTFRIRLNDAQVTPAEVITTWKERFPKFWPRWDHFYPPLTGIAPGEVALINMLLPGDIPHGLPISTGVLVLYADEKSFTFMTPEGHMFAGWITFSAYEDQRTSSGSTHWPHWQHTSTWSNRCRRTLSASIQESSGRNSGISGRMQPSGRSCTAC